MAALTEETFRRLQREQEEARSAASRAEGALSQLMTQLKDEFGCGSLEEAETLLENLEKKITKSETTLQRKLEEYQEKWKEV